MPDIEFWLIADQTRVVAFPALAGLGGNLMFAIAQVWFCGRSHQFEIVDPQSGNQLLLMTCSVAGQDVIADWSAAPKLWVDFGVPIIQSGKAYIQTS